MPLREGGVLFPCTCFLPCSCLCEMKRKQSIQLFKKEKKVHPLAQHILHQSSRLHTSQHLSFSLLLVISTLKNYGELKSLPSIMTHLVSSNKSISYLMADLCLHVALSTFNKKGRLGGRVIIGGGRLQCCCLAPSFSFNGQNPGNENFLSFSTSSTILP